MPDAPEGPRLFDRDTVFGMVAGAILGARGYSFWPAVGISLATSAVSSVVPRDNPVVPSRAAQSTPTRVAVDLISTMGAWWLGHLFFAPRAQLGPGANSHTTHA